MFRIAYLAMDELGFWYCSNIVLQQVCLALYAIWRQTLSRRTGKYARVDQPAKLAGADSKHLARIL